MSTRVPKYLALAAAVLGLLALLAGSPRVQDNARLDVASLAGIVQREEDHVSAVELAGWIRDGRPGLRIIDVRDSAEFESYHIPRAERVAMSEVAGMTFRPGETIVLYSDGGAHAAQAWVFLRALGYDKVYFLRGGLYEWLDDVMNPSVSATASATERAEFDKVAEVSRYFGGVPRVGEPESSRPSISVPQRRDQGGATKATVARIRGRGC